jgi:hypothetical protein
LRRFSLEPWEKVRTVVYDYIIYLIPHPHSVVAGGTKFIS